MDNDDSLREIDKPLLSETSPDVDTSEAAQIKQKNKDLLLIKKRLYGSQFTSSVDPLVRQDEEDRISDRGLKRMYANWFKWILIVQLSVMNLIFIIAGAKRLNFSHWALELYMVGTLAEVFGIVQVITKHLFPTKS
jgi:hypothetical protein